MARPFGPFALWSSNTQIKTVQSPNPFTMSQNFSSSTGTTPGIITQINAAGTLGQKLVLAMTGGPHSDFMTSGVFDMAKWTNRMDSFNRADIKQAIADGVGNGIVLGNSIVDEPEFADWNGTISRPMMDTMAEYVHGIFPTLPVGVNHGPTGYLYHPTEHFTKVDYVVNQYSWWIHDTATGVVTGDPASWRDAVLSQFATDGVKFIFSLNVLNGGNPAPSNMEPAEILSWGTTLGDAGIGLLLWQYDSTMFADANYRSTFQSLSTHLAGLATDTWKKSVPPPATDITVVGSVAVAGTSGSVPAHQAGDIIVVSAFNEGSSTIPSLGAGYTLVKADNVTGGAAVKIGYVTAAAPGTASGTWANATNLVITVLRGAKSAAPIGAKTTSQASASTVVAYPAAGTLTGTNGKSKILTAAVHTAATNVGTAPTGSSALATSASGKSAVHLTDLGVSSFAIHNVTVNASGNWRSETVEIVGQNDSAPAQPPVLDPVGNQTIQEGQKLAFTVTATDPDSVNLTFSLTGTPPGNAQITPAGAFTYTPASGAAVGSPYSVSIQVSDGALTDSTTIQVTVVAPIVPSPPIFASGIHSPLQRGSSAASSAD